MLLAAWLAKIMLKLLILNNDKYKLQYTMNKVMEVKMKYKSVFFKGFKNTCLFAICSTKVKPKSPNIHLTCHLTDFVCIGHLPTLSKQEEK